jgi:putative transposase
LVIQIDGVHIGNNPVLVVMLGIDGDSHKHPLGLIEGATENDAVVEALIDNLIGRELDGSKALSKAIRRPFGAQSSQRGRALA